MSTTTDTHPATSATPAHGSIRVFNTLSRQKEPLDPVVPGRIGIYLCGPTVYKPSHIGHMVGPVIFDTIKRYLVYCGYQVTWVVNITDVDDKLIAEANRRGLSMAEVADEMTEDYLANLRALGVDGVDHFPKATDNIDRIIGFIETLLTRGFAYAADGDVYFDVGQCPGYGKLSRRDPAGMQGEGGHGGAHKRQPADFALWKQAKPGEPSWPSPWGPGRPGWHIECSVMSHSLLGTTFDIHGGGLDLVFPHHENELAQSECCHGQPMAKYWLHNGLMQASDERGKVGGRQTRAADQDPQQQMAVKISKSTGAQPFRQLLERHAPETIRFFLLATHYRRPIDFSDERIDQVHVGLDAFYRFGKRYGRITGEDFYALPVPNQRAQGGVPADQDDTLRQVAQHRRRFLAAMDDDFNTGGAVGELFELLRTLNKFCDDAGLDAVAKPTAANLAVAERPNQQTLQPLDPAACGRDEPRRQTLRQGAIVVRELAAILGLFRQPPDDAAGRDQTLVAGLVELLVEVRAAARNAKDFATADRIRDRLSQLGIVLEDRPSGTEWSWG